MAAYQYIRLVTLRNVQGVTPRLKPATVNFREYEVGARAFQFVCSKLPTAYAVFKLVTARQVAGKASGGSDE